MDQEISKLRAANQRLSEIWLGQTAQSFIEKFESLMSQIQKLKVHLEDIYKKLLVYADQMAGRDQADADKFTAKFDLLADLNPLSVEKTASTLQGVRAINKQIKNKKSKVKEKSMPIKSTDKITIISVTYDGGGATYVINATTNRLISQEGGNFLEELNAYEQGFNDNLSQTNETPQPDSKGMTALGILGSLSSAAEINSSIQANTTSMTGNDYLEKQAVKKSKEKCDKEIADKQDEITLGGGPGNGPIFAGPGAQ